MLGFDLMIMMNAYWEKNPLHLLTIPVIVPTIIYHQVTLWVKGVGSTHIHPSVTHGVQHPDIVLAVHL